MEDYILKARFEDALESAYYKTKFIGFLDPAKVRYLMSLAKHQNEAVCTFWGGFQEAERLFVAVGEKEVSHEQFPFSAIEFTFREQDKLSHRDILGSFMASGVTRESVGDILVQEGRAVVYVKDELKSYFLNGINKIGKVGVKCTDKVSLPLPVAHNFVQMNGVIASERADCVIAFLMKSSREKAAQAIRSAIVKLNYEDVKSVSQKISSQDKISIKGCGKFQIIELSNYTKKQRLIIKCNKYV